MKLKIKLGQSEVELSGWNMFLFALAGFGLLAPGPAAALLATIETRLRGAGAAVSSWFFDRRRNPAGGPPLPSRWTEIRGEFDRVRFQMFWIYLIEMGVVFLGYTFLPLIPYFGGVAVCMIHILMALTPWVIFMWFGGEFLLPGLDALAAAVPSQVRGQLGGAVDALKRGLIRTLIPISLLYLLLGIIAILTSAPILPVPWIGVITRALAFATAGVAVALFMLGQNRFKLFSVLIVVGTAIAIVGSHTFLRPPNIRETALDTAEDAKLSEEAGLIKKLNFRKTYRSMSFWKEITPAPNRLFSFETLPAEIVMEVVVKNLPRLPAGDMLLTKTTCQSAFWQVDASTGNAELVSVPAGTELGVVSDTPTLPTGVDVVGPALEVRRRDDPSVRGFVQSIDTDWTSKPHLAGPVAEVWTRFGSGPSVHGFVSVADMDARTDPWEDRQESTPRWRRWPPWGPDHAPALQYSPPGTGTRSALAGSSAQVPSVHRGTITILEGTGSWPVPVDNAVHELPGLKGPAAGATKYVAIQGPSGVSVLPMFKDATGALQPFGAPWTVTTGYRYGMIGAPGSVGRPIHVKAW